MIETIAMQLVLSITPCCKRLLKILLVVTFLIAMSCSFAIAQQPQPSTVHSSDKDFDQNNYINIIATALTFLQPRTLDEHSIEQLCLWGLNGLNAIDPAFSIKEEKGQLNLYKAQKLLYSTPIPPSADNIKLWSQSVINIWYNAWQNSNTIQSIGKQAIIQAFFDELFDHMDPYSRYVAPSSAVTDRDIRDGGDASAGISLIKQGNYFIISSINPNGPSWETQLMVGQRLYAVDGKKTAKQSLDTVKKWLRGKENTTISLTVGMASNKKTKTVRIKRASVPPATVFAFTSNNIVMLKITSFSTDTAEEISQYLDQAIQDMKIKGLIIDLRGNRGGVLQQAITSAALLLDNGIAATTQGRFDDANHIWAVQGGDLTQGIPIVILVDGHTASAAEILAAALSDHKRAVIVGSTTLGKGLVQTIAQLPDEGELFVTWSRVLAPLGWPLQGLGVMPQLCTSRGEQFIKKQLDSLKTPTSFYKDSVVSSRKARAPLDAKIIQNIRSACPAALGTDADLDIANMLILKPTLYKQLLNFIPSE
ncbi:S41 family peptidase [Commensalibacter communis]|uniref:S41 family peptidase n=1 Tax=Commensalibacter communis TaxID=2972786 RepID=UPI00232F7AC2|nr:S41 family peptidase [Commensalibacter communis]